MYECFCDLTAWPVCYAPILNTTSRCGNKRHIWADHEGIYENDRPYATKLNENQQLTKKAPQVCLKQIVFLLPQIEPQITYLVFSKKIKNEEKKSKKSDQIRSGACCG